MRLLAAPLVAACCAAMPCPAGAALIGSCSILVLSNGQMTPDAAIETLSSKQAGGLAAQVSITAASLVCTVLGLLDCYQVSAPPPAGFLTSPSGGGSGVSFSSAYRINGGPEISGATRTEVLNGTYSVAIDLTADRVSGVFPAGSYQAQVTVRCE